MKVLLLIPSGGMFSITSVFLFLAAFVFAHGLPSSGRRLLAPNTNIIEALHEQMASGIDHPRFTLTADYSGRSGLFGSSNTFKVDVVLTNPSVSRTTSFSVDGGPSTAVQSTSKFFISDQLANGGTASKHFTILNVDEEKGLVRGLVQKDGKLLKLEQHQGGPTLVTEARPFDPPKDWKCTVQHEAPEPTAKYPMDGRHLEQHSHHDHDHSYDHNDHDDNDSSHTLNLSSTSDSIFSQVTNIDRDLLKNRRRRVYATDTYPQKWSYQVDLYIEIDEDLVNKHDTDKVNMPNTINYINALITAASSVYEKEVDTHLHVLHIAKTTLYDYESSTSSALDVMFNQYSNPNTWHYTDPVTGETPDLHHAILHKDLGGGVAYPNAVCDSWVGYGISTGIQGSMKDLDGEMFWDLFVIMHELGHNFGSDHTHDIASYNPQIDACGDGQCTSLVTGNSIKSGEGTIMSYCYLCSGGEGNIGMTFGGHWNGRRRSDITTWSDNDGVVPFSQNPKLVPKTMYEHVSTRGTCVAPYLTVPLQECTTDSQCNDGNSCTTNSCDVLSGTCTSDVPMANCCGNDVCEAGETESTCSPDCGPFTVSTPTCVSCWIPNGAMFDVEAINDITITALSIRIYGGTSDIKIYSAPQTYSGIETNVNAWTLIASKSVSTPDWSTIPFDIQDIPLSAGSKCAFYISASGLLVIGEGANNPIAADNSIKLLHPTKLSVSDFGDLDSGDDYYWVGSITYRIGTPGCFPLAKKVKVQSLTGIPIQMFELQVISTGLNLAIGKDATQSSDFKGKAMFAASKAVDENVNSFSHTGRSECGVWWEVDLGDSFPIESIKILNRYCQDKSDQQGCLCRLSHAAISLLDDDGNWVDAALTGNTCGVLEVDHVFEPSPDYCA